MNSLFARVRRIAAMTAASSLLVASFAAPCRAADPAARPPAAAAKSRLTALSPATLAILHKAERRSAGSQAAPASAATDSAAFFKTKKGAAVLVLLGAGFGYTLYSRFHDEIKSAIREE